MLLRQEALVIVERGFPEARDLGEGRAVCYHPMRCSLPGSSVHGILRARILQWAAMPSSRGSSQPRHRTRSPTLQVDSLPTREAQEYWSG